MRTIEDELLKWRFQRGSRAALARVYEKYVHALLSLAMGLLNDPHAAEDVVQDVFVSFAQGAEGFRLKGSLKAYLAQSVVNRVRDRARRQRSQQRRINALAAAAGSPAGRNGSLVYDERCERLSAALARLPYEQREAVVLKVKHEMKLKDIARLQGVSISTVHGRYRYGMEKLRALLDGDMDHER
ncbi:MAG: sigma-70 family RNA polymerase sigma factor [Phycisphaerales bacterium]|nr:MAG: sigma-70 family RNA polymerase sigma factor [Phycisphaerales bacterium]